MKSYFSKRPGTEINEQGITKLKRRDGSSTLITSKFWKEASIVNPPKLYKALCKRAKAYFIRAIQDEVIVDEDYGRIASIKGLEYIELPGNHNFEGRERAELLGKIAEIVTN